MILRLNLKWLLPTGLVLLPALALRGAEVKFADVIRESLDSAVVQYSGMAERTRDQTQLPRTFVDHKLVTVKSTDWTSGFVPGSFWFLFQHTGDPGWKAEAARLTALLEPAKDNRGTHDTGFILDCSFGQGYRLTHDPHYRDVLLTGAASLSTRFNPKVGSIKSWDNRAGWPFPVIIDNMMNLELLLWAAREGNQPELRVIALAHADTTLRNHYRPDNSSYHVVDYDPDTGAVRSRVTHQGAANESAWARGQAWGLYGFTVCYRESRKPVYLEQANKIAAFLMNHPRMPADKVPYWDFDAPGIPNVPRDASAAAVMSSALIELSGFVDGPLRQSYLAFAEEQLRSLASPAYRAKVGENGNFLLMHSTGHFPKNSEIDGPLAYADYYYLEALLRYQALGRMPSA
jgi:unsaturated chondroitin disaccharide hydrolase